MKNIVTAIIAALILIGGAFMLTRGSSQPDGEPWTGQDNQPSASNVKIENGIQIIEIKARGGYSPRKSTAKAGIPTVVRFVTNSTFDCSSAVRIPSLGVSKNLPVSGFTDVEIASPSAGSLKGSCSMGMYRFEIVFQN